MKKLLMILTVTAFAVVANAGEACCAAKKELASADKAACSAKATACSTSVSACNKNAAQKVAAKQLKSPRHASQS